MIGLVGAGSETMRKGSPSLEQKNVNNNKPALEKRWDQSLYAGLWKLPMMCSIYYSGPSK
ncbi:hypothetical protein NQ314_001724 [Rhamnusium bicolor]|uniref:Uncharacterized protein n=1 Tax=Rhamnusium bicolor TaxID=1586634 RepID=A0AAV8ZRL2_9CUCU|nr:hypothetical protein NQ314_001724 [Rhamnusium bicolor]